MIYKHYLDLFEKRYWFYRNIFGLTIHCLLLVIQFLLPIKKRCTNWLMQGSLFFLILHLLFRVWVFLEMFHGIHREWFKHLNGRLSSIFLSAESKSFLRIGCTMCASLNESPRGIFRKYTRQNQYFPWTPRVGKHRTCEMAYVCESLRWLAA